MEVLYHLMEQHRLPGTIRVDHGPEFTFKWLGNRLTLTAWNWTSVVQTNLLTTPSLIVQWEISARVPELRLVPVHGGGSEEDGILAKILQWGKTPQCPRTCLRGGLPHWQEW